MASATPPSTSGVRVRVPAKINLALKVGAPRPDGYHPLATVYQAVSLYDEVFAEWANPDEFEVAVSGEGADQVPLDGSNLAVRAAMLLALRHAPHDSLGARLSIKKSIPVAGGLAGGSANGAAALLACAVLWDLDVSPEELRGLAAELGGDVPFALLGGTAVGSGRGEDVAPATGPGYLSVGAGVRPSRPFDGCGLSALRRSEPECDATRSATRSHECAPPRRSTTARCGAEQ